MSNQYWETFTLIGTGRQYYALGSRLLIAHHSHTVHYHSEWTHHSRLHTIKAATMVDRGRLDLCKDIFCVDPRIRSHAPSDRLELLSPDYKPSNWDVICQGGKESYHHSEFNGITVYIDILRDQVSHHQLSLPLLCHTKLGTGDSEYALITICKLT